MVLVLSLFTLNAAASEGTCIEVGGEVCWDRTVTVAVTAGQTAANARLNVVFDSDALTYVGCETPFAVHTVRAEEEKLTIGLANPSSVPVNEAEELVLIRFVMSDSVKETDLTVTAEQFGGEAVNEAAKVELVHADRFQDVPEGKWFYDAVEHLAAEGYVKGISDTHFGPELPMNRASFVTLLGRLEGVAEQNAQTPFTDVPADSFYAGYVAWAVEKGITTGMTETLFGPAESLNRAQMVTFLYRYVVSEGIDVTVADPDAVLAQFPDADEVPDWAAPAFAWAVDRGIINGMDGTLAPDATSNRAQVTVMLYRFFFEQ